MSSADHAVAVNGTSKQFVDEIYMVKVYLLLLSNINCEWHLWVVINVIELLSVCSQRFT